MGVRDEKDDDEVIGSDRRGCVDYDRRPATASVRERIPHPDVHWSHLRSTPDGQTLYLSVDDRIDQLDLISELYASLPSLELAVIDTATNTVKRTVGFPDFGDLMLVSPSGKYVITVDKVSAEVHVLDSYDGRILARGRTAANPSEAALSPDGTRLYAINMSSGSGGAATSGRGIVDLGEFS